jgi:hypothetical protein
MLIDANPILAVVAKTKVTSQTTQPAMAIIRWPESHNPAAVDGKTRADRSAATPTARKSPPAKSVDPNERANHPLIAIPTALRASAALVKRNEARWSFGRRGATVEGSFHVKPASDRSCGVTARLR